MARNNESPIHGAGVEDHQPRPFEMDVEKNVGRAVMEELLKGIEDLDHDGEDGRTANWSKIQGPTLHLV